MNHTHFRASGLLLILSAITFWLSWSLMPDQGTADVNHILAIVKEHRNFVLASVIAQIVSSVLYSTAVIFLAKASEHSKLTTAGIILLNIGAMGMCADAFFHLLAYYMTDASVTIESNIVAVMTFMQTGGLIFLVPLLLPFFIGTTLMAIGMKKQTMISAVPSTIIYAAWITAVLGGVIVNKFFPEGRSLLVLTTLGLFALGQITTGIELNRK